MAGGEVHRAHQPLQRVQPAHHRCLRNHRRECQLGVLGAPGQQQGLDIVEAGVVVVRRGGGCLRQPLERIGRTQGRLVLDFLREFVLRLVRRRHVLVQELADLAFGQGPHEAVDRLAVHQQNHRGDALDAERRRQLLLLVGVDLDQLEASGIGKLQLFQQRTDDLAGPAPGRPEVHQHRLGHRRGDDLGFKVF